MRKSLDEGLLLARAARDDGIAFSELVTRTYPRALRVAYLVTGAAHAAEPVAQEALARLQPQLGHLTGMREFAVALYRLVAHLGRAPAPPPAHRVVRPAALQLEAALRGLSHRQRVALALREVAGLGYDDIGRVLGVRRLAAQAALADGRGALQGALTAAAAAAAPTARLRRPGRETR